jgi:undecaprenyl diphosphate synthase
MPGLLKRRLTPSTGPNTAPDTATSLDPRRLPRHVAVIMDGNGRWAKKRGLPRLMGHRAGTESVRSIIRTAGEVGVEALTLYAFSTENWRRSASEVQGLMRLLVHTLRKEARDLDAKNVRLRALGRIDGLPAEVRRELDRTIDFLSDNQGLLLNLALNYGGRQEIVDAARAVVEAGENITEDSLSRHLYTAGIPDPDLLIRTSGEMRLSNFLLWQSAYSEIYVTPVLWPDFRREQFIDALLEYQHRERRFGNASPA